MFAVSGFGTLLGNLLSARVLEATATDGHVAWTWFWLVPAAAAAVVFLLFTAGFRDSESVAATPRPEKVDAASATV